MHQPVTAAFTFSFSSSVCNHSHFFNYSTRWKQKSNLALHCLLCMHTQMHNTLAELLAASGIHQSELAGVPSGLCCWPHLPALVQASFLCGESWSGVSTSSGVLEKSFSLCGQMRGSSQIAPLMTFLLSLELLSLPKDNFPMMTKVSDSINFHLSEKCGSN